MSARDELAAVIESQPALLTMGNDQQDRARSVEIADAILAAGYTKPRTITTAEELDEVALLTVIRSAGGVVCEWYAGYWQEAGVRDCRTSAEIELPATVLYEPAP